MLEGIHCLGFMVELNLVFIYLLTSRNQQELKTNAVHSTTAEEPCFASIEKTLSDAKPCSQNKVCIILVNCIRNIIFIINYPLCPFSIVRTLSCTAWTSTQIRLGHSHSFNKYSNPSVHLTYSFEWFTKLPSDIFWFSFSH